MNQHCFQWTVIGAGPAGIAAIGQLLDAKIPAEQIVWIDPNFTVGDFGQAWKRVVSNTPVDSFLKFYRAFSAFEFDKSRAKFMIEHLNPKKMCPLALAAQPLKWITDLLKERVVTLQTIATALHYQFDHWKIHLDDGTLIDSHKIILALGAEAKTLTFPNLITIPFKTAINSTSLHQVVTSEDTIAVFGAYQSARSIAECLSKVNVKKIIHFYRSERSFEQHVASLPLAKNTESYPMSTINLLTHIPRCQKAIYAIGFKRRTIQINGLNDDFTYNKETGLIAPGLYGLGIAFPEVIPYTMGRLEYKVSAIWPFAKYLKKIFPIWVDDQYPCATSVSLNHNVLLKDEHIQAHCETSPELEETFIE